MDRVTLEQATKVANWWGEQLNIPGQNMGSKEHGGNEMANLLGTLLAIESHPEEEQIEKFKESLVDIIMKYNLYGLSVDYGPDHYLSMATQSAVIDPNCFPWKSSTTIRSDGTIFAKRGYGEKAERI